MKVKDLIELLLKEDPETTVNIFGSYKEDGTGIIDIFGGSSIKIK